MRWAQTRTETGRRARRPAPRAGTPRPSKGVGFADLARRQTGAGLIAKTRKGVRADVIPELASLLGKRIDDVGMVLGLSRATTARKIAAGSVLALPESDRAVRYVRLWRRARDLWESDTAAREWMSTPAAALEGEAPFDHATTEEGARQVEQLLGQIEHGIAT